MKEDKPTQSRVTQLFGNTQYAKLQAQSNLEKEKQMRQQIYNLIYGRLVDAFGREDAEWYITNNQITYSDFYTSVVRKAVENSIYDYSGIVDLVFREFNDIVDIIHTVIQRSKQKVTKPIIDPHESTIVMHLLKQMVLDGAANYQITFSDAVLSDIVDKAHTFLVVNSADREMVKRFINEELYRVTFTHTENLLKALDTAGFDVVSSTADIAQQLIKHEGFSQANFQPASNLPEDPWTTFMKAARNDANMKGLVNQMSQFIPQLQVLDENDEDRMVSSADLVSVANDQEVQDHIPTTIPRSIAERLCQYRMTGQRGSGGEVYNRDLTQAKEVEAFNVLRTRYSGLSTLQLIHQETDRFKKAVAEADDSSLLTDVVNEYNRRMALINNGKTLSIEEHPADQQAWIFEIIKAYARESVIDGKIQPSQALIALNEFESRIRSEDKRKVDDAIEYNKKIRELSKEIFNMPEFKDRYDVLQALDMVKAKVNEIFSYASAKLPPQV